MDDLWVGVDVRYVGADVVHGGRVVRSGTRAVVVEPGRHRVSSVAPLIAFGRAPVRKARKGVVIRLPDGEDLEVRRGELELVAPDLPLQPEGDGSLASWWLEELDVWGIEGVPVSSLVPRGFPAVAQVLHPFSSVGQLDEVTAAALVDVLTDATTSPADVFVAVWVGWGDVPPQRFPGAALLDTPSRGHILLRGPLAGVLPSVSAAGDDRPVAGLWWPADRTWFVATEVDFAWTFVAGSEALIERLLADERLEVGRTTFGAQANEAIEPS